MPASSSETGRLPSKFATKIRNLKKKVLSAADKQIVVFLILLTRGFLRRNPEGKSRLKGPILNNEVFYGGVKSGLCPTAEQTLLASA